MTTNTHPHTTLSAVPVITAPPPYSSSFRLRSQSSLGGMRVISSRQMAASHLSRMPAQCPAPTTATT
eukprot:CAMPEP_0197592768 /NCGR_PEP_ID=MMETSP1326-20131121/15747_1 /TAXON_ID=1155430 /ORGANISM="Genus nov. species nov., Strain RCC2288" /LENGTH=66 /DNA_ID=CAMNT_0043158531 /DNA_START=170 /DNA_END=366 /DNA_ORIENTATION=+